MNFQTVLNWWEVHFGQNEAFGIIMHWVYNENLIGSCLSSTWQANYNPCVSPLYVCVCFVCECCVTLAHTRCLPVFQTGNIFCSQLNNKRPQPWILTLRNLPLPWWLQEIPILNSHPHCSQLTVKENKSLLQTWNKPHRKGAPWGTESKEDPSFIKSWLL